MREQKLNSHKQRKYSLAENTWRVVKVMQKVHCLPQAQLPEFNFQNLPSGRREPIPHLVLKPLNVFCGVLAFMHIQHKSN